MKIKLFSLLIMISFLFLSNSYGMSFDEFKYGEKKIKSKKSKCKSKLEKIIKCIDSAQKPSDIQKCKSKIVLLAKRIERKNKRKKSKCGVRKKKEIELDINNNDNSKIENLLNVMPLRKGIKEVNLEKNKNLEVK